MGARAFKRGVHLSGSSSSGYLILIIDTPPIDTRGRGGGGGVVLHIPGKRVVRLVFSQIGLRNCPNRVAERESADQAFLL